MYDKMTEEKAAYNLFELGYDCGQTVFAYASDDLGLDEKEALKIASGFGGGMHIGEVCGCISGGLMALGLKFGYNEPNDNIGKNIMRTKTDEFLRRFKEANGAVRCKELLGYDVAIPDEKMKIVEEGLITKKCPGFVCSACEILNDLLEE